MTEIIIRILYVAGGVFFGAVIAAMFASAGRRGLTERMAIMRNCSKKQDDAIRRKQARIDELEREARRTERKK